MSLSPQVGARLVLARRAATALSFVLSILTVVQVSAAFDGWRPYATALLALAGFSFVYGVVLLLRPWLVDDLGRERDDPAGSARAWHLAGVVMSAVFVALFVGAHSPLPDLADLPSQIGHSQFYVEATTTALASLLIGLLVTLANRSGPVGPSSQGGPPHSETIDVLTN